MARSIIIEQEDEFSKTVISFELFFKSKKCDGGYGFACDEEGNILFAELNHVAAENAKKCQAGEMPNHLSGTIRRWKNEIRYCNCGSRKIPEELNDARGIYIAKVCEDCVEEVKSKYDPAIFTNSRYPTEEQVEADY